LLRVEPDVILLQNKTNWSNVNRIRVLIANHPRLMRELISTTMADQPDIELVGEVGKQQDLAEAVAETRPDVLTISMGDQREYRVLCGFLLGRYPETTIP
jgi:AmiR/NasT family two-component response regulator